MNDRVSIANGATYYELLHVEATATVDEIRQAFHRFARAYHPDTVPDDATRERLAAIYREGTEAYRILLDQEKRRHYDAGLAEGCTRYDIDHSARQRVGAASKSPPVAPRARTFYSAAKAAVVAGDWKTAHLNAQLALSHDPEHPDLLQLLMEVRQNS